MFINSISTPNYNSAKNYFKSANISKQNYSFKNEHSKSNAKVSFKSRKAFIIPTESPSNLEKSILRHLNMQPAKININTFANKEFWVKIGENIRNSIVFLMPALHKEPDKRIMDFCIKADACRRGAPDRIFAIIPNLPYGRQERPENIGEPVSARLILDLLKTSGINEVITSDLHARATHGFVTDITLTEIPSLKTMAEYFKNKGLKPQEVVIVSPDFGGAKRAEKFAKEVGCDTAMISKSRPKANESSVNGLIGDVNGKIAVIFDDMIDTAGTTVNAAKLLMDKGAKDVYAIATHGLFNGPAIDRLKNAPISEIVVTNSENLPQNSIPQIKQVDIAKDIADKMKSIIKAHNVD